MAGVEAVAAALAHPGTDAQRLAAGVEAMALAGSSTPAAEPQVERQHRRLQLLSAPTTRAAWAAPQRHHFATQTTFTLAAPTPPSSPPASPGATGQDLRQAAPDGDWLVRGSGMGFEPPVINAPLRPPSEVLEEHMVLSVSAGTGEEYARDTVLVTESTPEILSLEEL